MRWLGVLPLAWALASCTSFSAENGADGGSSSTPDASSPGAQDGGPTEDGGPRLDPCSNGATLFCEDFEGAFAPDNVDVQDNGGTLSVVPAPGRSTKALRATVPASDGGTMLALLQRTIGDGTVRHVVVEADVFVVSVPTDVEGEMAFLGVHVPVSGSVYTLNAYVDDKSTQLTSQFPGFKASQRGATLPRGAWQTVELEVDHAKGLFILRAAPSGSQLVELTRHTVTPLPDLPGGMRLLAGIQRYNDPTPALALLYDYVLVRALP